MDHGVGHIRALTRVAAGIALATWAVTALAQGAAPDPAGNAQAATDEGDQLQEVVITAQKRTERLEDIPVSAQVISPQTLAAANVADLSDLNNLVPSVQLNGTINGRVPTGVRGISSVSNEQTVGISSGVAIMIDGIPVPSDSFGANNVEGIQSVEVLLGPQSTLGGRTAAAGVINLTTRGPSSQLQGYANSTVTDDGEYRIEGFLSGPFDDRIQGSLDAYKSTTPYPIMNTALNQTTYQNVAGARAKLLFKLTDSLDLTLMAHDETTSGHGFNFTYIYITPGNDLLFTPGPFTQAKLLPNITPSWHNLDYASPVTSAGAFHHDTDYSVTLEDQLGGGYTLTSTTGYQKENQFQVQDLFAVDDFFWNTLTGQTVFWNTQSQTITVKSTTEELKIVSPADQRFSWLAGFFYSDIKVDEFYLRTLPPAGLDDIVQPDTATYDLYARSTWKFTDELSLVTGLRVNHDDISYNYQQLVTVPVSPPAYYSSGSDVSNTLVGDIALKEQFTAGMMGYLSYSRGYSPKAYNTSAVLTSNAPMPPVGTENINSFELGTKGTYFNRTLTLNADIFDTIYQHYQIQSYQYEPGVLTPPLNLSSVGEAETRGVELDTQWLATPTTELSLDAAYINAKFVDYGNAPCYGLQTAAEGCVTPTVLVGGVATPGQPYQDVSGDTMPNSPKFKGTVGIQQRVPMTNAYQWVFGGTFTYRTSAQMLPDQNPYAIQGGFGLLNLSAAFQRSDGKFSATAFVKNLTNHVYYVDVEDFWSGPWNGNAVIGEPARDAHRYAGLMLSASL